MARVTWIDACTHGGPGWVDRTEAQEFAESDPPTMSTVGFVLHEEPGPSGWIAMTDTLGGEECSSVHKIPNSMIISKEKL